MALSVDSPTMGPLPAKLAEETHLAGLKHGMIWTEAATGLHKLPATGSFYCVIGPKHFKGVGSEARAFAIVGQPLAGSLIQSARKKNVIDLSVLLSDDSPVWWPGKGVGRHRYPYFRNVIPPHSINVHSLDSHAGTHLVPPASALPPPGFDNRNYSSDVQKWLTEFQGQYGPRGTSDLTTEKIPLSVTCGWARVINVKQIVGTSDKKSWPASPEITSAEIKKYELEHGELKPGDIVIFHSSFSDQYCKRFPEGKACMAAPLNGESEGWPAPGPEAVRYLAAKGIRCIATDAPSLGGVEPKRALMTYWALGSQGMVGIEYLTNVGQIPAKAYFLFAAVKIRDCHAGPGRAIALY
jgi:kynurenine formamidase